MPCERPGLIFIVDLEENPLMLDCSEGNHDTWADPKGKGRRSDTLTIACRGGVEGRTKGKLKIRNDVDRISPDRHRKPSAVGKEILGPDQDRNIRVVSEGVNRNARRQSQILVNGIPSLETHEESGPEARIADRTGHGGTRRRDKSHVRLEEDLTGSAERVDCFGRAGVGLAREVRQAILIVDIDRP